MARMVPSPGERDQRVPDDTVPPASKPRPGYLFADRPSSTMSKS